MALRDWKTGRFTTLEKFKAGGKVSFQLIGTEAMRERLLAIAVGAPKEAGAELLDTAKRILEDAKTTYVPMDSRNLRNSGRLEFRGRGGARDTEIEVVFGDDKTYSYALAVHEHPSRHSPPTWRGVTIHWRPYGLHGPKYLERPFRKHRRGLSTRLADRIDKAANRAARQGGNRGR